MSYLTDLNNCEKNYIGAKNIKNIKHLREIKDEVIINFSVHKKLQSAYFIHLVQSPISRP
jgi:hypothetical protein